MQGPMRSDVSGRGGIVKLGKAASQGALIGARLLRLYVNCLLGFAASISVVTSALAKPKVIFDCHLPGRQQVTVTQEGDAFTYRHTTSKSTDLKISGTATSGNIFYWSGRYTNIEQQLRFINGGYSYVVFSLGANNRLGSGGYSGVNVYLGDKLISSDNNVCSTWSDLNIGLDTDLPEDDDSWSAM